MIKEIVKIGNPILRQVCKEVSLEKENKQTKELIQNLKDTLKSIPNAAGLASPQIGESKMIFVTKNYRDNKPEETLVFINPKIIDRSIEIVNIPDGCLSIPNVSAQTNRNSFINVSYINEEGKEIKEELQGFQSAVFQHEIDHLDGKLFIDLLNEQYNEDIEKVIENNKNGNTSLFVNGKIINVDIDLKK